jgi:hypothetical protein
MENVMGIAQTARRITVTDMADGIMVMIMLRAANSAEIGVAAVGIDKK